MPADVKRRGRVAAVFHRVSGTFQRVLGAHILPHSKLHLQQTQELTHVGSWEWLIDSGEITWSQEHYKIFGVTPEKYHPSLKTALKYVHPHDAPNLEKTIAKALDERKSFRCEFRLIRPDGSRRTVISRGDWPN